MIEFEIVRFTNWEEIFPDPKEADRQYADFLAGSREEYQSNHSLASEETTIDPETGSVVTVFRRTSGGHDSIQRLANGNVRMLFVSSNHTYTEEIVPEAGNKKHGWTYGDITSMAKAMRPRFDYALDCAKDPVEAMRLERLVFHLQGKPASMGWEKTMLFNNVFPQRIGYNLYHGQALQEARAELSHE